MTDRKNLPATVAQAEAWLEKYAASDLEWVGDLMLFNGKTGRYGAQQKRIEDGTELAWPMFLARAGFVKWVDGTIEGQAWGPLNADLKALRESLGDTDPDKWLEEDWKGRPKDPWGEAVAAPMIRLSDGWVLCFKSSSFGGVKAMHKLAGSCLTQMRAAPDTTVKHMPIIEIGSGSYMSKNKQAGQVFFPILCVGLEARGRRKVQHARRPAQPARSGPEVEYLGGRGRA